MKYEGTISPEVMANILSTMQSRAREYRNLAQDYEADRDPVMRSLAVSFRGKVRAYEEAYADLAIAVQAERERITEGQ